MPRKSSEAIWAENIRALNAPRPGPRPEPPDYLNQRAAEVWRAIVAARPPEYFDPAAQHLLASFCASAATADLVHEQMVLIDAADPKQRRRWNQLQLMLGRQVRLMALLGSRLKLWPTKADAERAMQMMRPAVLR
jgi:phage terminase small subunit